MLPVPLARRCVLTSAVGPDVSGSTPGIECVQMPERSGIDGEPFGCAYIGAAVVDTNVTNRRKFRCREFMLSSPFRAAPNMSQKRCYTLRARASKNQAPGAHAEGDWPRAWQAVVLHFQPPLRQRRDKTATSAPTSVGGGIGGHPREIPGPRAG